MSVCVCVCERERESERGGLGLLFSKGSLCRMRRKGAKLRMCVRDLPNAFTIRNKMSLRRFGEEVFEAWKSEREREGKREGGRERETFFLTYESSGSLHAACSL